MIHTRIIGWFRGGVGGGVRVDSGRVAGRMAVWWSGSA
ncbi:hypothetical protein GZL_04025 [Streptomyces sp. 769]|nr:hypothetical protein GZL_04025 [Streptomyces sp. 769]